MDLIVKYFFKANTYIWKHKILYFYGFISGILSFISGIFVNTNSDPYMIYLVLSLLSGYLWLGFMLIIPILIHERKETEKITLLTITKIIGKFTKQILLICTLVIAPFFILLLIFSIVFDVLLQLNITEQIIVDTTQQHGIGFYPYKAGFYNLMSLLFAPAYFFQVIYLLEKRSIWLSIKRSVLVSIKSINFILPIVVFFAGYMLVLNLFVPDGNYYIRFFSGLFDTYSGIILVICTYYYYKEHFKLEHATIPNSPDKESKSQANKIDLFGKIAIILPFLIFGELSLILFFSFLEALGFINLSAEPWITISTSLFLLFPCLIFFMRFNKFSIRKILIFPTVTLITSIILFSLLVYIENIKAPQVEPVKQQFTADEFWYSINEKRIEYGTNPLKKNEWLCVAAEIELNENLKLGNGELSTQDTYEAAVEETQNRYKRTYVDSSDNLPIFLLEYVTFGGTLEETIESWENGSNKLLFLDKEYTLGCVAAKDGYTVVITGKEAPPLPTADTNTNI